MLWDEESIRVWVFSRDCIPQDLECGRCESSPNPRRRWPPHLKGSPLQAPSSITAARPPGLPCIR